MPHSEAGSLSRVSVSSVVLGFSNFLIDKISPFFSPNVDPAYVL